MTDQPFFHLLGTGGILQVIGIEFVVIDADVLMIDSFTL